MQHILHRPIAWLLAVAVPMGAFCMSFLHAHVDAEDHHRAELHTHFSGHERTQHEHGGISLQDPERDRAIYLPAYIAVQTTIADIPAAPPPAFEFGRSPERPAHPAVEVTHGHDPPLVDALDSRPPPRFLPVLI
jgi:hypothetical protein